jgi:hypothetical protein
LRFFFRACLFVVGFDLCLSFPPLPSTLSNSRPFGTPIAVRSRCSALFCLFLFHAEYNRILGSSEKKESDNTPTAEEKQQQTSSFCSFSSRERFRCFQFDTFFSFVAVWLLIFLSVPTSTTVLCW